MEKLIFSNDVTKFIEEQYIKLYSVTKVIVLVNNYFHVRVGRIRITNHLKSVGLFEGLYGPNYLKKKVDNNIKCLQERYGVINWGQMPEGGWKIQNKIPYTPSKMSKEFAEYRHQVENATRINIKRLKKEGKIPTRCAYTDIEFADNFRQPNPNDPRKRTTDHMIPIMHCFLLRWLPEKAAAIDNIRFVTRMVNTLKGNTEFSSFKKYIPMIKERIINEDY